jgi:hypothetical protein
MTNTDDGLKFGALPAPVEPAPVQEQPDDAETLFST